MLSVAQPHEQALNQRVLALAGISAEQPVLRFERVRWIVGPPAWLEGIAPEVTQAFRFRPPEADRPEQRHRNVRGMLRCRVGTRDIVVKVRVMRTLRGRLKATSRHWRGRGRLIKELRGNRLACGQDLPAVPILAAGLWPKGGLKGGHLMMVRWIEQPLSLHDVLYGRTDEPDLRCRMLEYYVNLACRLREVGLLDRDFGPSHLLLERGDRDGGPVWIDQEGVQPAPVEDVRASAVMAQHVLKLCGDDGPLSADESQMVRQWLDERMPVAATDRRAYERHLRG